MTTEEKFLGGLTIIKTFVLIGMLFCVIAVLIGIIQHGGFR
jgi:hypothetical protein